MTNVDTMTALVLASRLGDRHRPSLSTGDWHRLVATLNDAGVGPDDLVARRQRLPDIPSLDNDLAARIDILIRGAGAVTFEYEELRRKGVRAVACGGDGYPERLMRLLGHAAPPLLFVVGEAALLSQGGVAIVGSRNVNPEGAEVAKDIARAAAEAGLPVVSGGARGVDQLAMNAAFSAGGKVVGVLADSLLHRIRSSEILRALDSGDISLATHQHPESGFIPAAATARIKIVYALSDVTVVVATDEEEGSAWAGAVEALERGYGNVAVWRGAGEGPANAALEKRGAIPLLSVDELAGLVSGENTDPPEQLKMLG